MTKNTEPTFDPFEVLRSPSGAVVVCRWHIVTNEIKDAEAVALAASLNEEFHKRMAP